MENKIEISNKEQVRMVEEVKVTSLELVDKINEFRLAEGKRAILQHSDFMKKIKLELKTLENLGILGLGNISLSSYINSQNKEQPCFELNKDFALQMLMSESTFVRYKTVEYINALEKEIQARIDEDKKVDNILLAIINSKDDVEKTLALKEYKAIRDKQEERLNKTIELNAPMVDFAQTVQKSDDAINLGIFSKTLYKSVKKLPDGNKVGRNNLFKWLRNSKYLISNKEEQNKPYQKYVDMGIFEVEMKTYINKEGESKLSYKPLITGKGQVYLTKKIKGKNKK